jgi:inhibitor of KinA sporulation pathway (predicted exonuclease)
MIVNETHHTCALYIDLELTFWHEPPPPGMQQAIIEIGIVEMELEPLSITCEAAYFVRPRLWDISPECTRLTGISKEDIRTARPFPEVLTTITEQFQPSGKICGTWGDDAVLIARTCRSERVESPFRNLLDVGDRVTNAGLLKQRASVSRAIEMLGLDFDGVAHGALADARNTAWVHAAIIRRMRRQLDPPAAPAKEPIEPVSRSVLAEKLSQCLRIDGKK